MLFRFLFLKISIQTALELLAQRKSSISRFERWEETHHAVPFLGCEEVNTHGSHGQASALSTDGAAQASVADPPFT